ncbi:MAG: cytochrome P450 [Myxococcota bacterium]
MPPSSKPEVFLSRAYQGEVLGEALFALLAERESDSGRGSHWRLLERLERHVKNRLRGELQRLRLPIAEDSGQRDTGRSLACAISKLDWKAQCDAIARRVRDTLAESREALDSIPPEFGEITRFFIGHEEALLGFTEEYGAENHVAGFLEQTHAPEEPPIPEGVQLMPMDPAYLADPAMAHRLLQQRAPVHRDLQMGGIVITAHDVVRRIAYDLEFFVDPRKAREGDPIRTFFENAGVDREPSMLFLDDPEHNRLRNLVSRSFTPRATAKLQPVVDRVAEELLDQLDTDGGPEFDLLDRIAAPLPAIAIARILGVDVAEQAKFKAWSVASSEAFFNPFAGDEVREAGEKAQASLDALFRSEIEKRRREPADDLVGKLVEAEREGDRLSESELVTMCNLLLIAGNVTTTDLIGNGMRNLLEQPSEHAKLRERPELVANAVEEMLRFEGPVQATGRIAPRDMEIDGVPVRQGESISLLVAAANRDPAVYPDPDRFDITRQDTHHLSFGGGAHLCIGAHLARIEAQAAVSALVARYPRLRPAGRDVKWKTTPGFRGLAEYWVRRD